ncbi:MAG: AAA family ATPase, partial [Caldilineaceae bacterium]|nr:AAA family ATPase [Caldilineaceae bacterium]
MGAVSPLQPEELYRRCDPAQFDFETTDDLGNLVDFIGQDRPIKAIELGIGIRRKGYNIFALGPAGTGKYTLLSHFIEERAAQRTP